MSELAVIIVNYNTKKLLRECLESIVKKEWKHSIEIWVVDNDSKDRSADMVKKEFPDVHLIVSDKNLGFTGGNNLALRKVDAENYMLLNSDTVVTEGCFDEMRMSMKRNNFDIVTCKLINPDGSLQHNAGDLPFGFALLNWLFGIDDLPFLKQVLPSFHRTSNEFLKGEKNAGWISGSAFMFKKEVLEKVGFLDEKIFMYCEDVDYCIRAQRDGFKIGWTDKAEIMHIGGASSDQPRFRQWMGEFKGLLYLYNKYFGYFASIYLRVLIYFAIILRMTIFYLTGNIEYTKTYRDIFYKL